MAARMTPYVRLCLVNWSQKFDDMAGQMPCTEVVASSRHQLSCGCCISRPTCMRSQRFAHPRGDSLGHVCAMRDERGDIITSRRAGQ
jgi:hypothetical protein